MNKKLSVAVAGDVCPHRDGLQMVADGKTGEILAAVRGFLDDADLRIVQWETPLTHLDTPIMKAGPNLKCPPEAVRFITEGGFEVALLANNHIGDFGPDAVLETMSTLDAAGVRHTGAGRSLEDSRKSLFINKNGVSLGIVNMAEHEFGVALKDAAGAAPLDIIDHIKIIRQTAAQCDFCLVVMHGGYQYNPFPTPRMVKTCRAFAEYGADAVVNIHPHCPQGIEYWEGKPIVYSPGNFYFPMGKKMVHCPGWWYGYLPKITFSDAGCSVEIQPYHLKPESLIFEKLTPDKDRALRDYIDEISTPIKNPEELQRYFDALCVRSGSWYVANTIHSKQPVDFDPHDPAQVRERIDFCSLNSGAAHHELMCRVYRLMEQYRLTGDPLIAEYTERAEQFRNSPLFSCGTR